MALSPHWQNVDSCSIYPSHQGDGFIMEIAQSGEASVQLKFPTCVVHQLMRTLPHIDAALLTRGEPAPAGLVAYPLLAWKVEGVDRSTQEAAGSVVLQLRNDRFVDTSLDLDLETATALLHDLGLAIAQARSLDTAGAAPATSRSN